MFVEQAAAVIWVGEIVMDLGGGIFSLSSSSAAFSFLKFRRRRSRPRGTAAAIQMAQETVPPQLLGDCDIQRDVDDCNRLRKRTANDEPGVSVRRLLMHVPHIPVVDGDYLPGLSLIFFWYVTRNILPRLFKFLDKNCKTKSRQHF